MNFINSFHGELNAEPETGKVFGGAAEQLVVWVGGALCAMFFGCALFGWYLAIAGSLDGHFNEIAAAALVDRYRQFIRFRLTPDRLTGYVIAIEDAADRQAPTWRVVDTFTVGTSRPAPQAGPTDDAL